MTSVSDDDDTTDAASRALAAFKDGTYSSKRSAAKAFGVNEGMLQHRKNGRRSRNEIHLRTHKFKDTEEKALFNWIKERDLDLDRNRARPIEILEMAREINLAAGKDPLDVTERWVKNFIQRKEGISDSLCKGYVSQIFQESSPETFFSHFLHLREVCESDITPDQIFTLSVSGLQMGSIGNITSSGEETIITSDPCNWITIIDCLNASGVALAPYIMFRGRHHRLSNSYQGLPSSLVLDTCLRSWSKGDILVKWLQDHFIPFLKSKLITKHTVLILEGSRHVLNDEFLRICKEKDIRLVDTLKNLPSHMHQLDITLIGKIKEFYHKWIKKKTYLTETDDQIEFFEDLLQSRKAELTQDLIKRRFKKCGINPIDAVVASKQITPEYQNEVYILSREHAAPRPCYLKWPS